MNDRTFEQVYLGQFTPPQLYWELAEEAWITYDTLADAQPSLRWFERVISETYGQAVAKGFDGDAKLWGGTIKEAGIDRMRRLEPRSPHRE